MVDILTENFFFSREKSRQIAAIYNVEVLLSLNRHITVRLTKIINNLAKDL